MPSEVIAPHHLAALTKVATPGFSLSQVSELYHLAAKALDAANLQLPEHLHVSRTQVFPGTSRRPEDLLSHDNTTVRCLHKTTGYFVQLSGGQRPAPQDCLLTVGRLIVAEATTANGTALNYFG